MRYEIIGKTMYQVSEDEYRNVVLTEVVPETIQEERIDFLEASNAELSAIIEDAIMRGVL